MERQSTSLILQAIQIISYLHLTQYFRIRIRSMGAQYWVKKQYLLLHSVLTEITVSLLLLFALPYTHFIP
jgi:hypothetical protein